MTLKKTGVDAVSPEAESSQSTDKLTLRRGHSCHHISTQPYAHWSGKAAVNGDEPPKKTL